MKTNYILFTTRTCPKCPAMKEFAMALPIEGEILDDSFPDFGGLAVNFGVTAAPTMIIFDGSEDNIEIFRGSEPQEIADFLTTL